MTQPLMQLGGFRFETDGVGYQAIKHARAYRWQAQARLLRRPAQQYLGPGEETITINGTVYPQTAAQREGLAALVTLADEGAPQRLVDSVGFVWGLWVIVTVEAEKTFFTRDGLAQKHDFTLTLKHYGEDQP